MEIKNRLKIKFKNISRRQNNKIIQIQSGAPKKYQFHKIELSRQSYSEKIVDKINCQIIY